MQLNGTLTGEDPGRHGEAATRLRVLSWLGAAGLSLAALGAFFAGATGGSVSLLMFGVDAAIIGFSSLVLLARVGTKGLPPPERMAGGRLGLAVQFFALSGLALVDSVYAFLTDVHADPGALGISVVGVTAIGCIVLAGEVARLGDRLGSGAVRRQGADHLLTGMVAFAVLFAAVTVAASELWVIDQLAGLLVAATALVQAIICGRGEGWGLWRGDAREWAR